MKNRGVALGLGLKARHEKEMWEKQERELEDRRPSVLIDGTCKA